MPRQTQTHLQMRDDEFERTGYLARDQLIETEKVKAIQPQYPRPLVPWWFPVLAGAAGALLVLWLVIIFVRWCIWTHDNLVYGTPRTTQYDAVVGHQDDKAHPSHFLVLNLQGTVGVTEFPASDYRKQGRFLGGIIVEGDGKLYAHGELAFKDVNGDGRIDIVLTVNDGTKIFLNNGKSFDQPQ